MSGCRRKTWFELYSCARIRIGRNGGARPNIWLRRFIISLAIPDPNRIKKSLGQHFLVDKTILHSIVRAAVLESNDIVVEIGPGRGVVTTVLANLVSEVIAIELDLQLCVYLDDIFNTLLQA